MGCYIIRLMRISFAARPCTVLQLYICSHTTFFFPLEIISFFDQKSRTTSFFSIIFLLVLLLFLDVFPLKLTASFVPQALHVAVILGCFSLVLCCIAGLLDPVFLFLGLLFPPVSPQLYVHMYVYIYLYMYYLNSSSSSLQERMHRRQNIYVLPF